MYAFVLFLLAGLELVQKSQATGQGGRAQRVSVCLAMFSRCILDSGVYVWLVGFWEVMFYECDFWKICVVTDGAMFKIAEYQR